MRRVSTVDELDEEKLAEGSVTVELSAFGICGLIVEKLHCGPPQALWQSGDRHCTVSSSSLSRPSVRVGFKRDRVLSHTL